MTLRALLYDKKSELSPVFWDVILKWWKGLDEDRGTRARLRRAKTPDEVFVSADFQRGLRVLLAERGIELTHEEAARLALGIGVLVHAVPPGKDAPAPQMHFARQLAPEDKSQVSTRDPRFRKLLATTEPEPLFLMLRRLVAYLGKQVEYKSLIQGASDWSEETRRDWAKHYYVYRTAR